MEYGLPPAPLTSPCAWRDHVNAWICRGYHQLHNIFSRIAPNHLYLALGQKEIGVPRILQKSVYCQTRLHRQDRTAVEVRPRTQLDTTHGTHPYYSLTTTRLPAVNHLYIVHSEGNLSSASTDSEICVLLSLVCVFPHIWYILWLYSARHDKLAGHKDLLYLFHAYSMSM
jgi:hypothetical protein